LQRNVQRILIFANGELRDLTKARSLLQSDDYIICADGGTRHALTLGIEPDLIIGDLDSVDQEVIQRFRADGVNVVSYPQDKNETDLELAIEQAIKLNPQEILIVAALGGRLDQTLANISLLSDPRLAKFHVRLDDGLEEIFLCQDRAEVHGKSGDTVSLIPWQGAVSGIRTNKLRWALHDETLYPDKTRGVSNEMIDDLASVSVGSGQLLIVHRRRP